MKLLIALLLLLALWWWWMPRSSICKESHSPTTHFPEFLHTNSNKKFASSNTRRFSSHVCVGGENEFGGIDWFHRRCVFKNLLYRSNTGEFIYTQDPQQQQHLTLPVDDFATYFPVAMQFMNNGTKLPFQRTTYSENKCLIIAHENRLGTKAGHDFDSIWHAFNILLSLRMLNYNNELVVVGSNEKLAMSKWWATLFRQVSRWHAFKHSKQKEQDDVVFACVVFTNKHQFEVTFPTFKDAYVPQLYRMRALHLLNITSLPSNNNASTILVRFKTKTHGFTNHTAVVENLQRTYPSCSIRELNGTRESHLIEEIREIQQADVYLTPGGGGSFSSIFVREGSTVLYGNVCWRGLSPVNKLHEKEFGLDLVHRNGRYVYCFRQDNFVWSLFNHFEKRYVSASTVHDISFPDIDTFKPYQRALRHSFMPNFTFLHHFVDQALVRIGKPELTHNKYGGGFPMLQPTKKKTRLEYH